MDKHCACDSAIAIRPKHELPKGFLNFSSRENTNKKVMDMLYCARNLYLVCPFTINLNHVPIFFELPTSSNASFVVSLVSRYAVYCGCQCHIVQISILHAVSISYRV